MFTKHLVKVILGFCAMILLGLASLVVINSMGSEVVTPNPVQVPGEVRSSTAVTLPPIVKRPPCCKTVTKIKSN
jgi:hypothetical protein